MRLKVLLLLAFSSLLVALVYFDVEFVFESKRVIPPNIVIIVNPTNYEINGRINTDLLTLLGEEFNLNVFNVPPDIIISSGKTVQYNRLIETINTLNNNGYGKVALSSEN